VKAAAEMASKTDLVVLAVGQDGTIEHEGHDRVSIALSDAQVTLINAVADAAKHPVVVVILTGGAVDVDFMLKNDKIGAIIHVGQPSVTVLGVGDLVFGKRVPAGRMCQTIYPSSFADEVSIFDFGMRPGPSPWPAPGCTKKPCKNGTNPGRTHRFYTGDPVVKFGFGLSYTTFKYSPAGVSKVHLAPVRAMVDRLAVSQRTFPTAEEMNTPLLTYAVNVTNTGKVDADDVVLGFIAPPGAGQNGLPLQSLFDFDRVFVRAGETVTVYLDAALKDFVTVSKDGIFSALPGEYRVWFGVDTTEELGMGYAELSVEAL